MVDLRGFGGSTGCLDWGGPGEQSDVVAAVQWAAAQPWSTGKVGMYGKSYDGVTGLIGVNKQPTGLAAVVSQEPVYDLYRYLYGDGMRRAERVPDAGALRPDRRHAGPDRRRPGVQRQRGERHPAPRLPRRQLRRPGRQRRPLLAVLAGAQPDPRRQGLDRPAVPDPGADGEQHGRRRHRAVPAEPHRLRARLARPVGARARQRARRERPPEDGPRRAGSTRTMRFYDRFLKGTTPSVAGPAGRGPDQRRQVALGGELAAGRREGATRRPCAPAATPTTARPTRPGRAPRRASGRSRKPLARAVHLAGSGSAVGRRLDVAAQRQPRARRLRPRRQRHRPADHAPGPPGAQLRARQPRPVVGGLEGPGRPPHRGQGRRRERRLVGARADQADGHRSTAARSRCRSSRPPARPGRSRARRAPSSSPTSPTRSACPRARSTRPSLPFSTP